MTETGIFIDVKDIARIAERLNVMPAFKDGMFAAGVYLKGVISEYPGSSDANSPKPYPGRWYERGYGTRYVTKTGIMRGKRTSQTLGKRWTVKKSAGGMIVTVGNNATYAKWVQGHDTQARFHKARGWKTTGDVADQESKKAVSIVIDFVEAKLNSK